MTFSILARWIRNAFRARRPGPARSHRRRLELYQLEDRITPSTNIAITSGLVVNTTGNPLSNVSAGENVDIEANWSTQNLPSNASYRVGYTVNGLTRDSNYLNNGDGLTSGSGTVWWGTFQAAPGINYVSVTVDPDHSVAETSYADNTLTFTFTASTPATGEINPTVAEMRNAYGVNSIPAFNGATADGTGQTIAIIDCYNDPTIVTDLDGFDQAMSLNTTSSESLYQAYGAASTFLTVYNQYGSNITSDVGQSGYGVAPDEVPLSNSSWQTEITIDVEWAHAMAPGAKIDLIETDDFGSIFSGDQVAEELPAVTVASNSWLIPEWAGETGNDSIFTTPNGHVGITWLACSGDDGAVTTGTTPGSAGYYPSVSPNVVSVGGSQLTIDNAGYGSEAGWSFPAPAETITNGGSGYSQTGDWGSESGGFSGAYSTAPGGSAATATWTMPITGAEEGWQNATEVSTTWTANPNNATNATYTIYDGLPAQGDVLGSVTVNQTLAPDGTADGGSQFQELGVYFPSSGRISVVLNAASANGAVVADAVGAADAWCGSGGISQYEPEPSYQLGVQSTGQRTTPDVAMNASSNSGVICFENGSLSYDYYGTSLASPCFAGLVAIANQGRLAAGGTVFNSPSNPQQILQALYSLPASDFNTVATGYNGYVATSGYDYNTGLGTPIANLLVPDLVGYGLTPTVTGMTPAAGPVTGGNDVTITGANLLGATAVEFGSVPAASFTLVSSSEIVAVPQAETGGTVDVTVTTLVGTTATSSADQYTFTSGPAIASLSPAAGPLSGGIPITISGTDLGAITAVDFGSTPAQITNESYGQIVVIEPSATAGTVSLKVVSPGGTATTNFTYITAPSISSISPPSGPVAGGTSVNIFGTNLAGAIVTFDGVPATIIDNTGGQIIVYDPAGTAGSQTLAVITPGGTSTATFTYVAEPYATGVSPAYGPVAGDTRVTITGTALLGATQVAFGGLIGTVISNSSTQIIVTSPEEAAGTVPVTVTTQGGTSAAGEFTFVPPADPATSTVSLSNSSVESGTGITVTLQAKDANGDDITTGGLTVTFALASTTGGQGNLSAVTDNGNGTYTATFTGTIEGSNNITATINGQSVTSGSPLVTVTPGSVSLQKSVVSAFGGTVASGSTDTITFTAVDASGNDLTSGGLTVLFSLGSGTATGTFGPVSDNGNGTYSATFTGVLAGTTTIAATVGGQPITSTQPTLTVTPGSIDPAASVVTLSADTDPSGSGVTVTLQTVDAAGNDLTTGGATVKFALGNGTGSGSIGSAKDNGNGTYTATFIGETAGDNAFDATVDGVAVSTTPPSITVVPGPIDPAACTVSIATGTVTSGSTDTLTLQAVDANGNDLTSGGATVAFILGNGTATGTLSSATDNGNGTYTATFSGLLAGANSITATVDGDPVSTTPEQVTVNPGPLDPANSAVSLTDSSVAAGNTIQVTVQARDAAGNDLTASGATVKLGLSTGSGEGNFGEVADNGNGSYTATFTGTLAGSYTLTATVDGTAVAAPLPTITVTPGSVFPASSTITLGSSNVPAGSGATVTLQAEDQYGNDLTTGGLTVEFELASGPGSGTFSSVTDKGNGTYSATFTGTLAGSTSITAWIDGDQNNTPIAQSITITAGPVDLARSSAQLSSDSVASGGTATVTVSLADANGNPIASGPPVSAVLESSTGGYGTIGTDVNNGDGTYSIPFSASTAGGNSVVVTVSGQQLALLPIQVTPGAIDASNSIVTLSTSEIQLGGEATVTLQTRDADGNDLTNGGQNVIFHVSGGGSVGQVTDNGNGTYTATVTGIADGSLTISATIGGQEVDFINQPPTLVVSGNEVAPAKSKLTLANTTVVAGQETTVTFQAEDASGQPETEGGLAVTFKLGSAKGGQGELTAADYTGNGTYTATFTGTIAGSNTITASVQDVSGAPKAASIKVTAGTLSWSTSEVTVSSETVKAGKVVTVTLQPTDAYGNKIVEKNLPVVFSLTGGSGQGTFGKVKYQSNGTYTATLTGTTVGTASIAATIDDTLVTLSPVITVTPGAASTKMSTITLSSSTVAVGGAMSITLQAVDADGNDLTTGGLAVSFKLGKGTAKGTFGKVTDNKNGTYTVLFTATSAGESPITATIGGTKVTAAPQITVAAA